MAGDSGGGFGSGTLSRSYAAILPAAQLAEPDFLHARDKSQPDSPGRFNARDMQLSAEKTIFEFNIMKFGGGEMGAANGMSADGSIIRDNEQAPEVWVGTTFGFAALLLSEGMKDEAHQTAWRLYHVIYESKVYWFRTPGTWDIDGNFRASMHMRPSPMWGMELMSPPAVPMIKNSQLL